MEKVLKIDETGIAGKKYLVLTAVLLVFGLFFLYANLDRQRNAFIQDSLNKEAEKLIGFVESDMRARIPALRRLVKRWQFSKGTQKENFIADVTAYLKDLPGFQAMQIVDKEFNVSLVVSLEEDLEKNVINIVDENKDTETVKRAEKGKKPVMSPVLFLDGLGLGFRVYFPIFIDEEFDGLLIVVFVFNDWLEYIFSIREKGSGIADDAIFVSVDGKGVFKKIAKDKIINKSFKSVSSVEMLGHVFSVNLFPTNSFISNNADKFPEIILAIGGIFFALFLLVMYLSQRVFLFAKKTHQMNINLGAEIQARKKMESVLKETSSRLELATQAGKIGVWSMDVETKKLKWNGIMYEIYGMLPDQTPTYSDWIAKVVQDDVEEVEAKFDKFLNEGGIFSSEFRIFLEDKGIRYISAKGKVEKDKNGNIIKLTGVNLDVTPSKEAEAQIAYAANHDALTGLPSLRLIKEKVDVAFSLARRHKTLISVMFLDLDGFKAVNDTYGHDVGDLVLKEASNRFNEVLRESDTVGRIGGDEFIFILNDISSQADAEKVAKKVIEAISFPFQSIPDNSLAIGVSIGIAFYPGDGFNVESLVKEADKAMYKVKNSGKNNYAFA